MEKRPKIYLSKSKSTSPGHITNIRNILLGMGLNIVEFNGGTYNPSIVLPCDMMIVIAPYVHDQFGEFKVGRGQYEEVTYYAKKRPDCYVLVVSGYNTGSDSSNPMVYVEVLNSVDEIAKDWQTNYGVLYTSDDGLPISKFVVIQEQPAVQYSSDDGIAQNVNVKPMNACVKYLRENPLKS